MNDQKIIQEADHMQWLIDESIKILLTAANTDELEDKLFQAAHFVNSNRHKA